MPKTELAQGGSAYSHKPIDPINERLLSNLFPIRHAVMYMIRCAMQGETSRILNRKHHPRGSVHKMPRAAGAVV